jgi:hypothetical protein
MTILPDNGQRIGTGGFDGGYPRLWGLLKSDAEHPGVWFRFHVFMPTPALRTRTGRTQQRKWINTSMTIVPGDGHFKSWAISCDIRGGWHGFSLSK